MTTLITGGESPTLNPAASRFAYAIGRFLCVGELLRLATSSNSPHTGFLGLNTAVQNFCGAQYVTT